MTSGGMNVNLTIGKVGNLNTANTIHVNKHPDGGSHISQTNTRNPEAHVDPLIFDGPQSSSPPRQDTSPVYQNHVDDLPSPVQDTVSSMDGQRPPDVVHGEEVRPQRLRSVELPAPITVEESTDYISASRECVETDGLNAASSDDPVAMSELKAPVMNETPAESYTCHGEPMSVTEPSEQLRADNTHLKQGAESDSGAASPHPNQAVMNNNNINVVTELKLAVPHESTDPGLVVDGPDLTPVRNPTQDAAFTSAALPGGHTGQNNNIQPQSESVNMSEDRHPSREGESGVSSLPNVGETGSDSVTANYGSLENRHSQQFSDRGEREEETAACMSTLTSAPTSIQVDGREGGVTDMSSAQNIFVVINGKLLVQDPADPDIHVMEASYDMTTLKKAKIDGVFPGGSLQLLQMKWHGYRDFNLSQWKINLKPDTPLANQPQDFVKHLCSLVLDMNLECLKKVTEQLKLRHNVFLHSLTWDGGLVIHLGHANPIIREKFMKLPIREAVQSILQQIVSVCVTNLVWEDPVPYEEEDTEDGRPPQVPEVPEVHSCGSSITSEDLYRSSESSPSRHNGEVHDLPSLHSAPQLSDKNCTSSNRSSKANFLMQLLVDDTVEEVHKRMLREQQPHIDLKELQQHMKHELANLAESQKKVTDTLTQTIDNLRHDLEKCQISNLIMSRKQEKTEIWQAEIAQVVIKMQKQLQDQNQIIENMRLEAKVTDEQIQEAQKEIKCQMKTVEQNLKEMDEKNTKHLENLRKTAEEAVNNKHEHVMGELNKHQHELKVLKQEVMQQKQWQEAFSVTMTNLQEKERTTQPAGKSVAIGELQETQEDEVGAVGGISRSSFSSALVESEKTTSKMKGKDEEMASNQLEERIHPIGTKADSFVQESRSAGVPVQADVEDAGEEGSASNISSSRSHTPQGGARSKMGQNLAQGDVSRDTVSPTRERKLDTVRESSQERTSESSSSQDGDADEDLLKAEGFLDRIDISISSGSKDIKKAMAKHVSAALKEEETPAPRAKCLDTILCLDVSDSIVSEGHLDTVKATAMNFVDGIEDLVEEMDIEENIAVVAVGGNARVVQHLTNDLTLVREAIESLDSSGGRSPYMQALMVCMAANKGRGGIVNVAGVYKVRPRIIFITDGCPTDEAQETGPDNPGSQTKFSLVQLLSQLQSKKHRSTPKPISWVPIGNKADEKFLQSLAQLSGGELVKPADIGNLCRYYKVQQTIGRLYKMVKNQEEDFIQDDKINGLLGAIAGDTITFDEKEYIVDFVKKLQKHPEEQEDEVDVDDFNTVMEDEQRVRNGDLPALGTRVVRGPHWKWKNQDTDGPGTVIQHNMKDNWIFVKWDNGTNNAYRYGEGGKWDIVETQHHPRQIAPDSDSLDFGVRVMRGPDWKRDNEDGHGPGTVIRCQEADGKVKVRWDLTGKIHEYNYSLKKGREVQVNLPEFPRTPRNDGQGIARNTGPLDDGRTIPMWKWRDDLRQWRLYDEATNERLEAEYRKRPGASCVITRAGQARRVSFKLMQEKLVDGGVCTDVTREMVDEDRKNDLLAMELSLQGC